MDEYLNKRLDKIVEALERIADALEGSKLEVVHVPSVWTGTEGEQPSTTITTTA